MDRYRAALEAAGVPAACRQLGIDFDTTFLAAGGDPSHYDEFTWRVRPHSVVDLVINAIPPHATTGTAAWEEWFRMDGRMCHFELRPGDNPDADGLFDALPDDRDHPAEVLGILWRYVDDPNLVPLGLR